MAKPFFSKGASMVNTSRARQCKLSVWSCAETPPLTEAACGSHEAVHPLCRREARPSSASSHAAQGFAQLSVSPKP